MEELKNRLIEMLKGYNFKELEEMLNSQTDHNVRGSILDAMELYHKEHFNKWINEL